MIDARAVAGVFASLLLLSGCADPAAPDQEAIASRSADRMIGDFNLRCAGQAEQGEAPMTSELIPAGPKILSRYEELPNYPEFTGRRLTFWRAQQDPEGRNLIVVEDREGSERCASVSDSIDGQTFADALRAAYPDVMAGREDDRVMNVRIAQPADPGEPSIVYTTYHNAKTGVSALVVSLAEREG